MESLPTIKRVRTFARQSPDDPIKEYYSRLLARKSLIDFTTYTYSKYIPEDAHVLMADKLMQVINGETTRLMIFAPPQHGKSELVSIRFPAFWLAHKPDLPVILTSYGASHAYKKATGCREVIESREFANVFPEIAISKKTRAGTGWRIGKHIGELHAASAGGPITGYGAGLGIIDDPIKSWEEAQSETIREKQWSWYRATFRTRIWENGAIIIIMTRWHEDDLAGRILNMQGEQWEVVRLPAISETEEEREVNNKYLNVNADNKDPLDREPGQPLCPKRFSLETLNEIKTDVGSIPWTAEYQGVPRAPEGNFLKRTWFQKIRTFDWADCDFVRYWDKAGTSGAGAYSTGLLMAANKKAGLFYIVDIVRGQWTAGTREAIIYDTAVRDRDNYGHVTTWVEQEPGSGGLEQAMVTVKNLAGFPVHRDAVRRSKMTRLNPGHYSFLSQAEALRVYMLAAPWNEAYLEELTAIPNNTYWDQIDATTGAFGKLVSKGWARGASE